MGVLEPWLFGLLILCPACQDGPTFPNGSHILWRYRAIGHFFGEPSADAERVFIAVHDSVIALSHQTGRAVWKSVPTGVFISTAAIPVADGVLFVLNGGFVIAYDAASGSDRWRTLLQPVIGIDYGGAAVEIGRDQVYAAKRTTGQGPVYALDRQTGSIRWHQLISPQPTRIAEVGDLVCVASDDTSINLPQGAVTCLSASDGEAIWRFEVPDSLNGQRACSDGGVPGRPTPAGSLLIFGDQCGLLFALELATGNVVWQRFIDTAFDSEVIVVGEIGYACTRRSFCMAFRVADGSLVWTTPHLRGSVLDAPIIVDDALYAVALGGFLYKIDRASGHIIAEVSSNEEDGFFLLRPTYEAGRIFTGGGDWFYGLEAP